MYNRVTSLLLKLSAEGKLRGKTATQVKDIIIQCLDPDPTTDNLYDRMLKYARNCHSPRTQKLYLTTARKLLAFDPHIRTMPLSSITRSWLTAFDHFMLPARPNTRAIDLRNIRTVINSIIDDGVECPYPFRTFKIPSKPTRHRTLPLDVLRKLLTDDSLPPRLAYFADLFRLSFYLIGMNTVDLYQMEEPRVGRVEYRRQKTGKLYSVKVEPEAAAIIERRRGESHYLDYSDRYVSSEALTRAVDRQLKKILPGLSMYYARHTWATVAASIDIPVDTISRALGHSYTTGAAVTSIYIEFDTKKVDAANRRVIDYVLYDKKD